MGFTIVPVPFEELSHTGDLRYRVTGRSKEELFAEGIRALSSTITDLGNVEEREARHVSAEGNTLDELLIEFLRASFNEFTKDEFVARTCRVVSLEAHEDAPPFRIETMLQGERFNAKKHPFRTEIKAVTYHGASVKMIRDGEWEAIFTLDL